MVDISTLAGITKTDHLYEVTSVVELTATYDLIEDSLIVIKGGGQLRHGSGCDIEYRNTIIVEEPDAYDLGNGNYAQTDCRWLDGCTVLYDECQYIIADSDDSALTGRRDFDVAEGASVTFRDFRLVQEAGQAQFNHFASADMVIDDMRIHNRGDSTNGAPFELRTELDTQPTSLTLEDTRTDTTSRRLFVALFHRIDDSAHLIFPQLTILKIDDTLNDDLRVLGCWRGDYRDMVTLTNPYGDLQKSVDHGNGRQSNLRIQRSYKGGITDLTGADLDCKVHIHRLGWDDSDTIRDTYTGTITGTSINTDTIELTITGVTDSRSVLTVGDPISFPSGTGLPGGLAADTTYYLRPTSTANAYRLSTTYEESLALDDFINLTSSHTGTPAWTTSLIEETHDEDDVSEWDVLLDQYRSASHIATATYRDRYIRSVTRYGYLPDTSAFTVLWDIDRPTGPTDSVAMREDPKITVTNAATISAYTGIALSGTTLTISENHTYSEIIDWLQHYAATHPEEDIVRARDFSFVTKDGSRADLGDLTLVISGNSTLTESDEYTIIETTSTITIEAGSAINGAYEDSSGVLITIKTTPDETLLRIEEYESDGTTLTQTIEGTSSADTGIFRTSVAADAKLRIYAKKWGYIFDRTDHDVEDGLEVDVSLNVITHIDPSRDISDYINTPYVDSTTPIDDNIYFEYDSTNNKGNWVGGEINTSDKFIITAALLDNRITSQEGLAFYIWFNTQDEVEDHLQGQPFSWSHDRLEINEDHMQFLRMTGMDGSAITRLGVNVKNKDGLATYIAPVSSDSRVQFDNLAILVPRSTLDDLSELTQDNIERDGGLLSDVHGKTEQMNFVGDDLKATLDGESVHVQDEHYYVPDTDDDKVYVYNRNKIRNESLEWNFHADHSSVVSLVWYDELWYAIHSPSGGTVSIGVYTPHGDRQTGLEFDLPSDIVWVQAAFILNGVLHVLTNTGSARKIHKVSLATHLEITPSIDLSTHTENVHGMDYYDGFVYVTDSRDDINDPQRVVVFAIDGTHDSGKSFNLVTAQVNPTGVTVTATRIIVIDAASTPKRIFLYDHTGAHQSSEYINLVTENAHPGGISLIKTTVSDLTRVARDVKTTLDYSLADITITDETVRFDDEFGNTIATFNRKPGDEIETNWDRGRERA